MQRQRVIYTIIIISALIVAAYLIPYTRREVKNLCLTTIDVLHPNVPVLLYHHILKEGDSKAYGENNIVVNPDVFEEQMQTLYDNGYTTITTKDLYDFIVNHKRMPKRSVLITFDDGYESNYIYAYPILKKFGFKATVFAITSKIKETSEPIDFEQLQYLSKESMQKSSDVFEFGSHSDALHYLTPEKTGALVSEPADKVEADTIKSKAYINTTAYSYPYGMYNKDIIKMLQANGFTMAVTNKDGRTSRNTNIYKIPRYSIFHTTPMYEFKNMVGIYDN